MLWYVGSKNSDELNVVAWSFFFARVMGNNGGAEKKVQNL